MSKIISNRQTQQKNNATLGPASLMRCDAATGLLTNGNAGFIETMQFVVTIHVCQQIQFLSNSYCHPTAPNPHDPYTHLFQSFPTIDFTNAWSKWLLLITHKLNGLPYKRKHVFIVLMGIRHIVFMAMSYNNLAQEYHMRSIGNIICQLHINACVKFVYDL